MNNSKYIDFLKSKMAIAKDTGFEIDTSELNPALLPHQKDIIKWAIRGGRRAVFAQFGLGKTVIQLEFCKQVTKHKGGKALIVCPLGVKQEFVHDAVKLLGYDKPQYVKTMAEVRESNTDILITNYERVRDGDIDVKYFAVTSLDEAAVLRSFGSKTYQEFLKKFAGVPYKMVATPSYNDLGHNEDNDRFFEQMNYLTPNLLRVLKPGRVACIHVKDRILFGNATGDGMPTVDPFSDLTVMHYMKHGFRYMGRITITTDVVRENNQTYRLGWTEQCKDGSKMGIGCPEYVLLFRKLPTDISKAYADTPVKKSKDDYTRGRWQIDAHAYWRSSGNRLVTKEEVKNAPVDRLQKIYSAYSKTHVYNFDEHIKLAEKLDADGRLPATFMVIAPSSWSDTVWDDINRMRTLNAEQKRRDLQMHVCPLQLDIVERLITRYSNEGDVILDPFGGIGTVPMTAIKMKRFGMAVELNADYFRDGVGYCKAEEDEIDTPTLFDYLEVTG